MSQTFSCVNVQQNSTGGTRRVRAKHFFFSGAQNADEAEFRVRFVSECMVAGIKGWGGLLFTSIVQ